MSLFSKIMKPIRNGLAPTSRRNMGGLGPRVPMPPRRKGGSPELIRSLRDEIRERPRFIRGVGGVGQEGQLPIAPVIPKMPSFGLPDLSALQNISPAVKDAMQQSLATGEPILSQERVKEMIDQPPVAPPVTPPLREKILPPKILPPLPPQDFGFGPGIRPTEIRDPDGRIIGGPASVTPPQQRPMIAERPVERIAEIGDPIRDEGVSYLGGSPTFNEQGSVEAGNALQDAINNQTLVTDPVTPSADPVTTAPTPSATTVQSTDPIQSMPAPVGALDPVLLGQKTTENLSDPLTRALYFGTQDQPGFYQQLQQAGANLIGQDVPLQQTAGLTPLELLARQQAVAGLGGFEPFLQQNRELINQAIAQSRRAEELQDPYYTQAEEIYKDTMGAYDPSMTQQFYNPFEDAVVQQTIQDVMEAGEKQDIASRAREISAGAFGGSRARLGAMERQEALGEGLAQALGRIRQQGFSEAQRTGLSEFARQQAAKRTGASGLIGIGTGRGSAASSLGQQLAGYGGELSGLGAAQENLRSGQRSELAGFGSTGRGIAETGLSRIYQQQLGQQQRPLGVLGQIGSMLPGYQQTSTQIDSQYGLPTDPSAAGLGAAFSAYGALAPKQGQS